MSDPSNGGEEASASIQLPPEGGPPPSKRKRPNEDSETEPEAESCINLRQLLLNPLIEDESIDLFPTNQELSYDVGTPWKEFTSKVLETQ